MKVLRTPDARFEGLADWPFAPSYAEINGPDGEPLRIAFVDEGPRDGAPVLLMHGEPSWSYLYRHIIPKLVAKGHRVLAPDLIGFGRSDKPAVRTDYTYERHVDWMSQWFLGLDLKGVVRQMADALGWKAMLVLDDPPESSHLYRTDWVVITGNERLIRTLREQADAKELPAPVGRRPWTDDYNNLFEVLK